MRQHSHPAPGISQGLGYTRFICPHLCSMDVTCLRDLLQFEHLQVQLLLLGLLQ